MQHPVRGLSGADAHHREIRPPGSVNKVWPSSRSGPSSDRLQGSLKSHAALAETKSAGRVNSGKWTNDTYSGRRCGTLISDQWRKIR
jgi:hypothetical protein